MCLCVSTRTMGNHLKKSKYVKNTNKHKLKILNNLIAHSAKLIYGESDRRSSGKDQIHGLNLRQPLITLLDAFAFLIFNEHHKKIA